MARRQTISIRRTLRKLFPDRTLRAWAHETRAVQRERKVDVVALFWTLVLGFGVGRVRTLAGLRRSFEKATGVDLVPSSFYKRFTPELAAMLKRAAAQALDAGIQLGRALEGPLSAFRDLVLTDSTVIRLHRLLENSFPASRTNHTQAAAKMHVVLCARSAGQNTVKITDGRTADGPTFKVGRWVAGRLLLFDLGYFCYRLFANITRNRGFFVSRLKLNANPTIVALNRRHRGRTVDLIGRRIRDVVARLDREILDVMVEVEFRRRRYAGRERSDRQTLRVVGIKDPRTGEHRLYVTNVSVEQLAAEDIRAVYAARWEIELLFKLWKRHYRLEDMPSAKEEIVHALLYTSIVTLVVSNRLAAAIRQQLGALGERVRDQRWAAVFVAAAQEMLFILVRRPGETELLERSVLGMLLGEAVDPNAGRKSLLQAVENRTHAYR